MSAVKNPPPKTQSFAFAEDAPRIRTWTREEFYKLAEQGYFEGQRAERIEGEIMVMSPPKWLHASTTDRVTDVLRAHFSEGFWVRMQLSLALLQSSDPEPDVSVVSGRRTDYTDHPTAAVLVVEVADSSLAVDRAKKAPVYATAGIPEYWIVNLVDRQLEVYRNPQPDPTQPSRRRYSSISLLTPGQSLSPQAGPDGPIAVADLLS